MQEEVENRTVTLTISGTKLTGRTLKWAIRQFLNHHSKSQTKKAQATAITPRGKQTVAELVGQNQGVQNIEISDKNIRDFDRVARKYGIDYAVKKDILPDMHEALVSRSDFYQVREVLEAGRRENNAKLEASREYREKHPQIFKSGIVRCGCCGSNLGYSRHGEKKEGRYSCRNKQYGRCDTPVSISEKKLAPIVWNAVQTQLALFADFEKVAGRLKDSGIQTQRQTDLQQEMLDVSEKLSGYQKKREQLYNDYVDGILSAGDYIELKGRFDAEYQEQSARLNQLSVELAKLNRMLSSENKWLANIRNIRKARKLTPEVAQAMIDHINVYKTGYAQRRLEIIFRFQEERDVLEAVYHELEGGEPQ